MLAAYPELGNAWPVLIGHGAERARPGTSEFIRTQQGLAGILPIKDGCLWSTWRGRARVILEPRQKPSEPLRGGDTRPVTEVRCGRRNVKVVVSGQL